MNNETKITVKRVNKKNRKRAITRSKKTIIAIGLTAIVLVVATYAWFIGITTVSVDSFEVNIVTTEGLSLSLDGDHWETQLHITKGIIEGTEPMVINGVTTDNIKLIDAETPANSAYPASAGNVNHWATAGGDDNHKGLEPVSSSAQLDGTNSQAKFYSKTTLTSEAGGYRLAAGDITSASATGYIAFDVFIKNASGSSYTAAYNKDDDEAIFLTGTSTVTYDTSGSSVGNGIQNSVRVGFYALGRVNSRGIAKATIQGINCGGTGDVTSLCNKTEGSGTPTAVPRGYNWNIWEPNDKAHIAKAVTRFNNACIKRTAAGAFLLNEANNNCLAAGTSENEALADNKYIKTYTISNTILSSDTPISNIYDGLNGYTNPKMTYVPTLTDTENSSEATRNPLLFIAPSSITKIRVYIYLEGQDVDNFDLATEYQTLKFNFGLTKDRYEVAPESSAEESASSGE